jgi:hypothetical protein
MVAVALVVLVLIVFVGCTLAPLLEDLECSDSLVSKPSSSEQ